MQRDLKSKNVILCEPESTPKQAKIGDFGIAKKFDKQTLLKKTVTQTVRGATLNYCSPEVKNIIIQSMQGVEYEKIIYNPEKAEVFSLGLIVLAII